MTKKNKMNMKKLMILSLIAVAFIIASCTNTGKKVEPVTVDSTTVFAPVDTVAVEAVVDTTVVSE